MVGKPDANPPQRPRVLLVEDDDGVRRSLHLILQGKGYDVRSYGAAGLVLADPDIHLAKLLIADYRLPDGDGIELRRALAEQQWHGRSVLITAFASPALRDAAERAGYDVLHEKPVRPHVLTGALEGGA